LPVKKKEKAPAVKVDPGKSVEDAVKKIKEGGVVFQRVGDAKDKLYPVLRTGLFAVDHGIFCTGGFSRGRIHEIYGAPSGGKGTITTQLIAQTQIDDPKAEIALVDAECAFDPTYANKLGADTSRLLWAQPVGGEVALQATIDIIESGKIKLAIVDSIAALVPRAELEGTMTDEHMGLAARMMGKALRKMTGLVSRTNTTLIFINQVRTNMGVSFGDPTSTPGGKALKFFASSRTQIDRIAQIKEKEVNVGNRTKIANKKNKGAAPFRTADLDMYFDLPLFPDNPPGFDGVGSLVELAIEYDIWSKDGAKYILKSTGECITGKRNLRDGLVENVELQRITEIATLTAMGKTPAYIKSRLG
jgi:recombination protein RecA